MFHTSNSISNRMWWGRGRLAMFIRRRQRALSFKFKIQFLHLWPFRNPIYSIISLHPRANAGTNLLHVDFMQHNGSFSPAPERRISSRKKGWNYTYSHRFMNYGEGLSISRIINRQPSIAAWNVGVSLCPRDWNCFSKSCSFSVEVYSIVLPRKEAIPPTPLESLSSSHFLRLCLFTLIKLYYRRNFSNIPAPTSPASPRPFMCCRRKFIILIPFQLIEPLSGHK